jgi:membrane-bound lytic murein transglycosylase
MEAGAAGTYLQELQEVTRKAEDSLRKAKLSMKERWDRNRRSQVHFKEGDQVLIQANYLPSTRQSKKLDNKWRGPFMVIQRKGNAAYEVKLPPLWRGHNVFNEARMKKFEELVF